MNVVNVGHDYTNCYVVDADKFETIKQSWANPRTLNVWTVYPGHGSNVSLF